MEVKTTKRDGKKHVHIIGVERGDMIFVIPLLILYGLSEADATEGFRQTIQGSEFSCETDRHVNVCCTKR